MNANGLSSNAAVWQFIRFLAVGGAAAVTYVTACTILVAVFPKHGGLISIIVHCSLIPISFFFQRNVAFRSIGPAVKQFLGYFAVQLVSIFLSTAIMARFLTDDMILNGVIFVMIASLAAISSFCIYRVVIFSS